MNDPRIFEHTDDDGDSIRVVSWANHPSSGLVLTNENDDDDVSVSVRLYADAVLRMTETLVAWYSVNGSQDITLTVGPPCVEEKCPGCGHTYGWHSEDTKGACLVYACDCPRWNSTTLTEVQPEGIRPADGHDDPGLRLEALRLAVQWGGDEPIATAREFEAYLKSEEPKASDPSQDSERDCLCHHPKWLHRRSPEAGGSNGACRLDACSCTERRPW